jgi:tetratricopeptide (TPR) repeat protein
MEEQAVSGALVMEANTAYEQGEWDQAIEAYTKALEADPNDAESCRRLADVRAIRGNLNQVVDTYLQLMDILCSQGNYSAALQVADWVKCIKPESDAVRAKVVDIYIKLGDMAKVVQHSMELARLYIELGVGESAISLLIEAQKADPGNLDIGLELAETYVSQGHMQEGAKQYRLMGHTLIDQGNLERAAEAFRRLKLILPDDAGILLTLGNIYVDLKRYNEAEQEFRSILRHNLNHEEALLALGRVCQLKCQWRDAILAFNRILNINPNEITAKGRRARQSDSTLSDCAGSGSFPPDRGARVDESKCPPDGYPQRKH